MRELLSMIEKLKRPFQLNKRREKPFKFKPFSQKQKMLLTWWHENSPFANKLFLVAEGAVRSGKTVAMVLSFIFWANANYEGEAFALCGKTIGSLRRNVIKPLKQMLEALDIEYTDHLSLNFLTIGKGRNEFYLFGGKDESSQDLIQGFTLAGVLFDEVTLMPESFVNQAVARCSVEGAKFFFNCNPGGPYHWFKTEWLEQLEAKNGVSLHFTMDDNLSLSPAKRAVYKSLYTGVFFKRYILGLWVMAQGLIFDMFSEDKNIKSSPFTLAEADRTFVSIDYGIQNPMTFGKYGVKDGHYHLFESYYHSGRQSGKQKTDKQYCDDLFNFIGDTDINYITVDPSATSFIAEIRSRTKIVNGRELPIYKVIPARNAVLAGIATVSVKLAQGLFTIDPSCEMDKKEFGSYVWDEKAAERGEDKPVKKNDHCMDRNRYGIYTDTKVFKNRVSHSGRGART